MKVDIGMQKLFQMIFLLMVSTSAMAEWTALTVSQSGDTYYGDLTHKRKVGKFIRMWTLVDTKTPQVESGGLTYNSAKTFDEYDCLGERRRLLAFSMFSENMGKGNVVSSSQESDAWKYIAPESIDEVLFKFACQSKK